MVYHQASTGEVRLKCEREALDALSEFAGDIAACEIIFGAILSGSEFEPDVLPFPDKHVSPKQSTWSNLFQSTTTCFGFRLLGIVGET
mmetsp:Transcript_11166/g.19535  ORF Transcript_11166/g.19535 Transcript_11166/m.19535 type:complete len:88 (-) Transcript_11166:107-370(-)